MLTKSSTLRMLKDRVPSLNILPICVVTASKFREQAKDVMESIVAFADGRHLIVRSSSSMEDAADQSNAGKFTSVLDVAPTPDGLCDAINAVLASYGSCGNDEEVLIQPMLADISKSGVAFTADMETFADYYIINYTDGTDTAAVTGGHAGGLRTLVVYKHGGSCPNDPGIARLLDDIKKIEDAMGARALDIEFAITNDGVPYIFQARPIAIGKKSIPAHIDLDLPLERINKKVRKLSMRHPFLLGRTSYFGVMPDWNPAEILGARPKKLAISLYKELITDSVWAQQRYRYGYRDLTMHPLMISFCGIPYIDTRIMFNSFIPQKLSGRIAEKLANYYLDKLNESPRYHDKVEFEIVWSCYYLGLPDRLKALLDHGFNQNEITRIEFALLDLTNSIIARDGLCRQDIDKISILERNYEVIVSSDISLVDKIYWLIEECKAYGTLPFAGAARAAFIAVQFLRSFVDTGIISAGEYDAYMASLSTVSKRMSRDTSKLRNCEMSRGDFLKEYGHIRPGTYDITSARYDEAFDNYFGGDSHRQTSKAPDDAPYSFTPSQIARIDTELEQNGLFASADDLMHFIKASIEGREHLKFVFTKSVSMILKLIEELGRRTGISRDDMAHLDISVVKQLYVDLYTGQVGDMFRQNIEANRAQFETALQIKLPSIITSPDDVYMFHMLDEEPNFITRKSVTADVTDEAGAADATGRIAFIRSADPGYDYLFSKDIGGLVTQFGGANSHMAIRCAELGIPAVIGAGEQNFNEWRSWGRITIDCMKKVVLRIG